MRRHAHRRRERVAPGSPIRARVALVALVLLSSVSACRRLRGEGARTAARTVAVPTPRPVVAEDVSAATMAHPPPSPPSPCVPLPAIADGPALTLENDMPRGETGTTHTPDRSTIRDPASGARIVFDAAHLGVPPERWDDSTEIPPILERVVPLSRTRALVIGWSSLGSGMQAEDALLIGDGDGHGLADRRLRALDRLHVATQRGAAALFLCRGPRGVRIGVPFDGSWADRGDDVETLVVGGRSLAPAEVVPVPAPAPLPGPSVYAPPFGDYRIERVVWIDVAGDRFRPEYTGEKR